jgi:primosomal protein N' (replication factor Y) (superfamily II helicase)
MSMYYYEVWVASQRYHSDKALTYAYEGGLSTGSLVVVPLQRQKALGVVTAKVSKPSFSTKQITSAIDDRPLPKAMLDLIRWMKDYYPAPFGQIMSLFLPTTLAAKSRKTPLASQPLVDLKQPPRLTPEQKKVITQIKQSGGKSVLLHGDTGTGKTRIYIELAKDTLQKGKSVIILTPEIGLTPQLTASLQEVLPAQTVVMHSNLSPVQRRNVWLQILSTKTPLVIVGPRSALFTPLQTVGLIVVDECHETSYKQEQTPHYLATHVAAKLAELHAAQLILGSATPSVADYFTFASKDLPIVRMTHQALPTTSTPVVKVVDLKDKALFRRSPWISDPLLSAIEQALARKEQTLIFLNRRGTARLVLCSVCGWQALCIRCDLPLTYHGDKHVMSCHTCGYSQKTIDTCPECSASDIIYRGAGTKSMDAELRRLFPQARISRFDSDTTKSERLEHQYTSVKDGDVDILVGTQVLGKGLDLPKLSVVGIITAETSLSFPDYTAEERTFQLMSQVLGRVNRGHLPGMAIVQSYHPTDTLLLSAISKDFESFYTAQIQEREKFGFPPFRYTLKLFCSRSSSTAAQKASEDLANTLKAQRLPIEVIGPSPAFTEKTLGKYRWQIILKATHRKVLVGVAKNLPANWNHDIDPLNLL